MSKQEKDIQWLGEEDAHLGPAARAALGILLETRDWAWWHDPSKTFDCLNDAAPRYRPSVWGGDASLLDADQWVDPLRALALARAFESLKRRRNLTIKVARSVWSWPGGSGAVHAAVLELSKLLGSQQVFPEWESRARPRFPEQRASSTGRCVITSPTLGREAFGLKEDEDVEWSDNGQAVDIVIAGSVEAVQQIRAAKLIIIYGQPAQDAFAKVSVLRRNLYAQSVVHVQADGEHAAVWLQEVVGLWVSLGVPLRYALRAASDNLGLKTLVLSSTQSFIDSASGSYARFKIQTEYVGYSGRRMFLKDYEVDVPPEVLPLSAPPTERILTATVVQGARQLQSWPTSGPVDINVGIELKTPLHAGSPAFPEDRIEWQGESKLLQVHMFELGQKPVSKTLLLPRVGSSEVITFSHDVDVDEIDVRFIISDGAQLLQTARLQAQRGGTISFFIEAIVTPLDREKTGFDVALLVNDSLGKQPSLTAITADGRAVHIALEEYDLTTARQQLLNVLDEAVANPNAPLAPLMVKLANRGKIIMDGLREVISQLPNNLDRVQLVTQSDAFFPIEYLFEGTLPDSSQAPLCAKRAGCLNSGQAISDCIIRASGEALCPMGFLGVSAVIERHSWQLGRAARVWRTSGGQQFERHRIKDLSNIAFAASNRADEFEDKDVLPHEVVRIAGIEAALGVNSITDWKVWKAHLDASQPSPELLLLLVHVEDKVLYVGANSDLNQGAIDHRHIRDAQVVIAIGCSTGLGDARGGSLPAILQRNGARVVIAAMTTVLGRHANRVARDLSAALRDAAHAPTSSYVGNIMSGIRRKLLADGLALGLAVVAFGDADVVLGKG
ncbi:hypothetical protein SAMN05216487_1513 [Pseudomonas sp. UC 17F4]|uniref:hypothetical protein n=1 Tax=Pseudomonas sp. UC 17F4 TaxID=1855328 RepID=UPI00088090FD|nr:hypothetical protein [Pseudomonas sp. UC 17F4]SDQ38544.1 hypothetical protein SAMN05216487_1513 [Pseudomonas sp. UC 17F4]